MSYHLINFTKIKSNRLEKDASLKIVVFVAIVFVAAVTALVYYHQTYPDLRASIVLAKDMFVAVLTVGGIAVAAESLRRSAASARASLASRFIERWNDPNLAKFRDEWHTLYYDLKTLQPTQVIERLDTDSDARTRVTDVLNFFEETAHAVNTKVADKKLLDRLLGDTIRDYYSVVLPRVEERRKTRPDAWTEITMCWIVKS